MITYYNYPPRQQSTIQVKVPAIMNEDSFFKDYILDYYLKAQLLFDRNYTAVLISTLTNEISLQPPDKSINPKSSTKISLHRNKEQQTIRQFLVLAETASSFNQFKLNDYAKSIIKTTASQNYAILEKSKRIDDLLKLFTDQLIKIQGTKQYYTTYIQLIDILLVCSYKAGFTHTTGLLNKRKELLNSSYVNKPTDLSDPELKRAIVDIFDVTPEELNSKLGRLSLMINKEYVFDDLKYQHGPIFQLYSKADFKTEENWKKWYDGVQDLFHYLCQVTDTGTNPKNAAVVKYIPKDIDNIVKFFIDLMIDNQITTKFYQSVIECFKLWQVDPFVTYMTFLSDSKFEDMEMNDINRVFVFAKSSMNVQLELDEWPNQRYNELSQHHEKIFKEFKNEFQLCLMNVFENFSDFTDCLEFLNHLKFPEKDQFIVENFTNAVNIRIHGYHNDKSPTLATTPTSSRVTVKEIFELLDLSNYDLSLVQDWRIKNRDLNAPYNFQNIYINRLSELVVPKMKTFFLLHDTIQDNLLVMLEAFGTFTTLTKIPIDYQTSMFGDVLKLVESWNTESKVQVDNIVLDDDNLQKLSGCSYSKSVQNVFDLISAYLKIIHDLNWKDEQQLSLLNLRLFDAVSMMLNNYSTLILNKFMRLIQDINIDDGKKINQVTKYDMSCTALNNINKVLQILNEKNYEGELIKFEKYYAELDTEDGVDSDKLINVKIKNAEDVEDRSGQPVSLYCSLKGVLSKHRTRCIYNDFDPDWNEQFQITVNKSNCKESLILGIEIVNAEMMEVYKYINYRIKPKSAYQDCRFKLAPNSGYLNVTVEIENIKDDPIYALGKTKRNLSIIQDRCIKLFVDKFTTKIKRDIFTKEHLTLSLKTNPPNLKNDYKSYQKLNDETVDSYLKLFNSNITDLYDSLETNLFDEIINQIWAKVLSTSTNLLLPRISILSQLISNKLNKRSSLLFNGGHTTTRFKRLTTTREEFVRVIEWCYKFKDMLISTEMVLPETLEVPLNTFLKLYDLFQIQSADLKANYYQLWNKLNEFQLPKLYSKTNVVTRGRESRKLGDDFESMMSQRELILRVLICKNEYRFVKRKLEIEERFKRIMKTEIDVYRVTT